MEIENILKFLQTGKSFLHSPSFFALKFFLSVYTIVLIIDIILVIILRGAGADVRTIMKGIDIPAASKGKMTKRWQKIVQRLESGEPSQYKAAILEAHKFFDEILKGIGYHGGNMAERLEQARPGQLDNLDELWKAHKIRNQIIRETGFNVDKDLAQEIIGTYEKVLRDLEFVDK